MGTHFSGFLIAAAATAVLLLPLRALLRRAGVVDRPNARSSHAVPTVRGGGVAIVAVAAAAMGWLAASGGCSLSVIGSSGNGVAGDGPFGTLRAGDPALHLLGAFLVLAVVSFIDDLRGLKASLRLVVQLACAVAAVAALITNNGEPITITALLFGIIAVIWVAGYTNAFNFMDGINGIAAVQAVTTALGTAAIAYRLGVPAGHPSVFLACVVAGAALGFLPHNFPRARVFMGDVSSATLGFLLASLAYWIAQLTSWWVLFWLGLLHANFVLDTGITLIRRARRGDRLQDAHREHFYQRLVRAGASHTQVTLTQAALQVLVGLALWWATPDALRANAEGGIQNGEWIRMLAVGVGVIGVWLAYFWFAERKFQRAEVRLKIRNEKFEMGNRTAAEVAENGSG